MIHLKNTFQKVLLITAVWVSFIYATLDQAGLNACKDTMKIFGLNTEPLECIKIAMEKLKLNGNLTFTADLKEYYISFRNKVLTDKIKVPGDYCVENTPGDDMIGYSKCLRELYGFITNSDYVGGDDELLNDFLFHNALYYHKQCQSTVLPFYHGEDSYGYSYMNDIKKVIQLKDESLENPGKFCETKYNPQDPLPVE